MSAATAIAFARAAPCYWGSVYPQVRREVARQRDLAGAIGSPMLRETALATLQAKRANIDGAAAFAAFVPRARRAPVVRAQVAFQALYDYLDVLAEQPHCDPVANSRLLHGALLQALDPHGAHPAPGGDGGDAYREHPAVHGDGGYLQGTVSRCQAALRELPGYAAVQPSAARLGGCIVEYQTHNLPGAGGELARWATAQTPPGSGLAWWETAASAGSSLGVLALIAMASQPDASEHEAVSVEGAYFPWVGALHSLLDSLIDLEEDRASGQPVLIANYGSRKDTAAGLRRLAEESRRRTASLAHGERHLLLLAAMASLYLAEREASAPHARPARRGVLGALGGPGLAAMAVMRVRRAALSRGAPGRAWA